MKFAFYHILDLFNPIFFKITLTIFSYSDLKALYSRRYHMGEIYLVWIFQNTVQSCFLASVHPLSGLETFPYMTPVMSQGTVHEGLPQLRTTSVYLHVFITLSAKKTFCFPF
jgi:hypothetical protein